MKSIQAKKPADPVQLLLPELEDGEEILWAGRPEPNIFTGSDSYFIPLSIIVLVAWGESASDALALIQSHSPRITNPIEVILFYICALLLAFYLCFLRFPIRWLQQRNTGYGVTNKRIIVVVAISQRLKCSLPLKSICKVRKFSGPNNTGTIIFNDISPGDRLYGNTGTDFCSPPVPVFYEIKQADLVCRLVANLRLAAVAGQTQIGSL